LKTAPLLQQLSTAVAESAVRAGALIQAETERLARFQRLAFPTAPAAPRWATPAEVVPLSDALQLRCYDGAGGSGAPVLVVTPQVNHSYIADFAPDQSLVRTLLLAGVARVAVTDWLPPPPRDYFIADSIADIRAARAHLAPGGSVHLIGLCQGGWQAAIVAALHPAEVASLTVAAAPIDARAGCSALRPFVDGLPRAWFEGLVAAHGGVVPGQVLAQGFDLLRAHERHVLNYVALYLNAADEDYCRRYEALRNWYRLHKAVAGGLYLEAVDLLFKQNLLVQNRLTLDGRRVDLGRITGPVHLVAGARDHITPAPQVFALEGRAPRATTRRYLVDAGHIGVFMGKTALRTVWPVIAQTFAAAHPAAPPPR
jgi:poly(3-hydroxybutyrate) depolymerase